MSRVRTTLTIDAEVIERYKAIAQVQGQSLSSSVSDWLKSSVESAELVASELHRIKGSLNPGKASAEVAETLRVIRERYSNLVFTVNGEDRSPARPDTGVALRSGGAAVSGRASGSNPPSSNTGGKGTKKVQRNPGSTRSSS